MATYQEIAAMIDHSILKPAFTDRDVEEGCRLADSYGVATVCVRPCDVILAKKILAQSPVKVTTVIGFPHGTTTTAVKTAEAAEAITNGCTEIDVVCNIGKVKSGDWEAVRQDLAAVITLAHSRHVPVKVIFENCYLTDEEIIGLCGVCNGLDADWVKTSTGFGTSGAEIRHLKLMRTHAKPSVQVKAAGGIRSLEQALEVRALGCTRFGCTVTKEILDRLK